MVERPIYICRWHPDSVPHYHTEQQTCSSWETANSLPGAEEAKEKMDLLKMRSAKITGLTADPQHSSHNVLTSPGWWAQAK